MVVIRVDAAAARRRLQLVAHAHQGRRGSAASVKRRVGRWWSNESPGQSVAISVLKTLVFHRDYSRGIRSLPQHFVTLPIVLLVRQSVQQLHCRLRKFYGIKRHRHPRISQFYRVASEFAPIHRRLVCSPVSAKTIIWQQAHMSPLPAETNQRQLLLTAVA